MGCGREAEQKWAWELAEWDKSEWQLLGFSPRLNPSLPPWAESLSGEGLGPQDPPVP